MHLDPDTLAAFSEGALAEDEKPVVFAHLAECETCREWLANLSELKRFSWMTAREHRYRSSPYFQVAAAVACTVATIAMFVHAWSFIFIGKNQTGKNQPREATIASVPQFALQPDHQGRRASRDNARHLASTRDEQRRVLSGRERSATDQLSQRNLKRLVDGVSLARVSFRTGDSARSENGSRPKTNQIALMTSLGERWITVSGFWPVKIDGPDRLQ